MNLRNLIEHD
jgi:hypothetical protein